MPRPPRPLPAAADLSSPTPTWRPGRFLKSVIHARAQGRTHTSYEFGIPLAQAYEKLPWLQATLRALGVRRIFFLMNDVVLDFFMRAPSAAAAALPVAT